MFSLMRQQLYITSALSYISIALFIFIAFMVTMPSVYIFAVIVGVFILTVFYADHEHKSLRFTASLPVTKTMMVKSRYYFLGTVMCLVILWQWLIMRLFGPLNNHYVYEWVDIVTILSFGILIIAIFLPVFYGLRSFPLAIGVLLIGYFIGTFYSITFIHDVLNIESFIIFNDIDPGFARVVKKYIPIYPYIIFPFLSILLYIFSIRLSVYLLTNKDL